MLFEAVDSGAGRQCAAAVGGRHRHPVTVDLAEIFASPTGLAVFLDKWKHYIVDRFEIVSLRGDVPHAQAHNVVASPGLPLRHQGQEVLVTVRGDEVDRDLDLLFLRPLVAELEHHLALLRDPMIPDAKRELACGVGAAHERCGKRSCSQRRGPQHRTPRQHSITHFYLPAIVSGRPLPFWLFVRRLALTRLWPSHRRWPLWISPRPMGAIRHPFGVHSRQGADHVVSRSNRSIGLLLRAKEYVEPRIGRASQAATLAASERGSCGWSPAIA